jgi:LysR family transcriptional regulator for bpeEF and oprC
MALFVSAVEGKSFSQAAREFGITPSAVSKRISKLEDELGVQLMRRTTRSLALTDIGALYFERAKRIMEEVEEMQALVTGSNTEPQGVLRVNMPTAIGQVEIAPAVPAFLTRFPKVQFAFKTTDRVTELHADNPDIAIWIGEFNDTRFVSRKLMSNNRVVCGTPEYFDRHGTPKTPRDLDRHNCLINPVYHPQRTWPFTREGKQIPTQVSGNIETDNYLVLLACVTGGLGISLLPEYLVAARLRDQSLRAVLTNFKTVNYPVFALYPRARYPSPKVQAFLAFLEDHFSTGVWAT